MLFIESESVLGLRDNPATGPAAETNIYWIEVEPSLNIEVCTYLLATLCTRSRLLPGRCGRLHSRHSAYFSVISLFAKFVTVKSWFQRNGSLSFISLSEYRRKFYLFSINIRTLPQDDSNNWINGKFVNERYLMNGIYRWEIESLKNVLAEPIDTFHFNFTTHRLKADFIFICPRAFHQ